MYKHGFVSYIYSPLHFIIESIVQLKAGFNCHVDYSSQHHYCIVLSKYYFKSTHSLGWANYFLITKVLKTQVDAHSKTPQ